MLRVPVTNSQFWRHKNGWKYHLASRKHTWFCLHKNGWTCLQISWLTMSQVSFKKKKKNDFDAQNQPDMSARLPNKHLVLTPQNLLEISLGVLKKHRFGTTYKAWNIPRATVKKNLHKNSWKSLQTKYPVVWLEHTSVVCRRRCLLTLHPGDWAAKNTLTNTPKSYPETN